MLYCTSRRLLRTALAFYFARIERFHRERVPPTGPLLFASNHPNSLTDAFVIGTAVPRKVNFVATVPLFRLGPVRWLLTHLGVIAINRVKDDPHAMRTVKDTFESCFQALERQEAVAIFPEGVTHDDPQLRTVKTGAARMALEFEHRHGGAQGLRIVPVGLTFSAKETYRSAVLVNFGEPIRVRDFLAGYPDKKRECIQALTDEIEARIKGLMLHLRQLERSRIIEAIKRLYLDRLLVGNRTIHEPVPPQTGELMLTQAIALAVDQAFERHPARAAEFVRRLGHYERAVARLHLSEEVLAHFPEKRWLLRHSLSWSALALLGAPVALYGWAHRLLPYLILRGSMAYFAKAPVDRTHISTVTVLWGGLLFTGFYGGFVLLCYHFFGWPAVLWYGLSLPAASLAAHYYWKELRRFWAAFRAATVLVRSPAAARRLLAWRAQLIAVIEAERRDFLEAQGRKERAPV